jgi:hypothetical protein
MVVPKRADDGRRIRRRHGSKKGSRKVKPAPFIDDVEQQLQLQRQQRCIQEIIAAALKAEEEQPPPPPQREPIRHVLASLKISDASVLEQRPYRRAGAVTSPCTRSHASSSTRFPLDFQSRRRFRTWASWAGRSVVRDHLQPDTSHVIHSVMDYPPETAPWYRTLDLVAHSLHDSQLAFLSGYSHPVPGTFNNCELRSANGGRLWPDAPGDGRFYSIQWCASALTFLSRTNILRQSCLGIRQTNSVSLLETDTLLHDVTSCQEGHFVAGTDECGLLYWDVAHERHYYTKPRSEGRRRSRKDAALCVQAVDPHVVCVGHRSGQLCLVDKRTPPRPGWDSYHDWDSAGSVTRLLLLNGSLLASRHLFGSTRLHDMRQLSSQGNVASPSIVHDWQLPWPSRTSRFTGVCTDPGQTVVVAPGVGPDHESGCLKLWSICSGEFLGTCPLPLVTDTSSIELATSTVPFYSSYDGGSNRADTRLDNGGGFSMWVRVGGHGSFSIYPVRCSEGRWNGGEYNTAS